MSDLRVELVLTRREADELLRADFRPRTAGDGRFSVQFTLESARDKLRDAIDRASRG